MATLCGLLASAAGCTRPKADEDPPAVIPEPPPIGPSCERAPACVTSGDADQVSCCQSLWVPGGTYLMGFSPEEVLDPAFLADEDRDHPVTVSGYFLDRFEVTWSRFEQYAAEFAGPPVVGSGAHPALPKSGWQSEWDLELPETGSALLEGVRLGEPSAPGAGMDADALEVTVAADTESFAADRLSWFVAFAFCIWDGGRLPTEAEWEYAATGGDYNWAYPWGNASDPGLGAMPPSPVGSREELRGRYGHDDLAGGVLEWAFDWLSERYYVGEGRGCLDCANQTEGIARVLRGASDATCCSGELDTAYRAASRNGRAPGVMLPGVGARCARDLDGGRASTP